MRQEGVPSPSLLPPTPGTSGPGIILCLFLPEKPLGFSFQSCLAGEKHLSHMKVITPPCPSCGLCRTHKHTDGPGHSGSSPLGPESRLRPGETTGLGGGPSLRTVLLQTSSRIRLICKCQTTGLVIALALCPHLADPAPSCPCPNPHSSRPAGPSVFWDGSSAFGHRSPRPSPLFQPAG